MVLVATALVLVLLDYLQAPLVARVKETGVARVPRAQALARDVAIREAVVASNAVVETPDQIRRRDAAWIANQRDPLRRAIVKAPCSDRVRELVKDDPLIVEALVINDRGTLVCSIAETSDYWQGDELKWQRTFVDGREALVEEPAFDASSGMYAVQVSVLIAEGVKRLGVVTLTLRLHRQEAAATAIP